MSEGTLTDEQQLGQEILELNQVLEIERRDNLALCLKSYQATREAKLPKGRKRQLLNHYAEKIIEYGGEVPTCPPSLLSQKLASCSFLFKRRRRALRYGVLGALGGLALSFGSVQLGQAINANTTQSNKETAVRVSTALWYSEQSYKQKYGKYTTDVEALKEVSGTAMTRILDGFDGLGDGHEGTILIAIDGDGKGFTARVTDDDANGEPTELKSDEHPGISWREGDKLAGGCTAQSIVRCTDGKWDPRQGLLGS